MGQIRKLFVATPNHIQEQQEIAKRIEEAAKVLNIIEEDVTKLRSMRIGLMQDLLTGKKRVTALFKEEPRREKIYA
jgi:type I restriction enzyme S subunit